jgi:hypothetical protein
MAPDGASAAWADAEESASSGWGTMTRPVQAPMRLTMPQLKNPGLQIPSFVVQSRQSVSVSLGRPIDSFQLLHTAQSDPCNSKNT